MRITVDVSPAVRHNAGVGRYAHELLAAMLEAEPEHEYNAFYTAPRGTGQPEAPLDRLPARTIRLSPRAWRWRVLLADRAGFALDDWLPPGDLFHATDHVLPPLRRSRSVFTVYDLTYRLHPESHQPLNRWFQRLTLRRFLRRADAIVAISENTRRDVIEHLGVTPAQIDVIYPGVSRAYRPVTAPDDLAQVRARYQLPERFILSFCTLEPRKNLVALLEAYCRLRDVNSHLPRLVLAGRKGWQFSAIFQRLRELGLESCTHFTGWVEEADAPALLSAAAMLVYPSLYEGFGLPPLEAMACGTPVITSSTSSLPEVVGEAGMLVDPRSPGDLAEAMGRLLEDASLRGELSHRGLARARQFTWARAARETLDVYRRVVGLPGSG